MRIPEQPPDTDSRFGEREFLAKVSNSFADPAYSAMTREVETAYLPWSRAKYRIRAAGLDPEVVWARVRMSRMGGAKTLPLRGGPGQHLHFNMPDILLEELMHIDQKLAGIVVSTDEQPINMAHQERFMITALREEAIASSLLEGAETTRQEAKEMLSSGRKPRTHGEKMVANNYQAMTFLRENRDVDLTPELILKVQSIVTDGTLKRPNESGRFRTATDPITITDMYDNVLHTPPPAEEISARLKVLCAFMNNMELPYFIHPVVRASVFHFQFGYDHPFCDGNGRTARALFYWAMLRAGYWLFEYLPISRLIYRGPSRYGAAFLYTETDNFDVTYFLVYKAQIIRRARQELSEYITRKNKEMRAARKVFESDHRLNHRQREVISTMLRSPQMTITVQDHQSRKNVVYATARSDLMSLEQWGYLKKYWTGKRYEFERGDKMIAAEEA